MILVGNARSQDAGWFSKPLVNHSKHLTPNPLVTSASVAQVSLIGDRPGKLVRCACFRELMTSGPVDGR